MTITKSALAARPADPAAGHAWSPAEKSVLVQAARRSLAEALNPPWTLSFNGQHVELIERADVDSMQPDPRGRDRLIACGGAVATLAATFRMLGWEPILSLFPDAENPALAARLTAARPHRIGERDVAEYSAIFRAAPGDQHEVRLAEFVANAIDAANRVGVRLHQVSAQGRVGIEVCTPVDSRWDHVSAGVVVQQMRLAARRRGAEFGVVTEPFRSSTTRCGQCREGRVIQSMVLFEAQPVAETAA